MQPKFVAAQKMLLKQKATKRLSLIARFYYFRHLYSAGSACVFTPVIAWVIDGRLYLHCSLIYFWVCPSSCFCIVISLSEGEIIDTAVSASRGEAAYARQWWPHWLTDCWCATDDDQRHHHAGIIFSFGIANSFRCILHQAQQHHADASACQ